MDKDKFIQDFHDEYENLMEEYFKLSDVDNKGYLTFDEYMEVENIKFAYTNQKLEGEEKQALIDSFSIYNKSNDGKLTLEEIKQENLNGLDGLFF
jgi:Ca2+-binding EF-hand superfamily protein